MFSSYLDPPSGTLQPSEFKLEGDNYDMTPLNIDNDIGRGMILYTHKSLQARWRWRQWLRNMSDMSGRPLLMSGRELRPCRTFCPAGFNTPKMPDKENKNDHWYLPVINWEKSLTWAQNVRQSAQGLPDILSGTPEIIFAITVKTAFSENIFLKIKLNENDDLLVGLLYRSDSGAEENNTLVRELLIDLKPPLWDSAIN